MINISYDAVSFTEDNAMLTFCEHAPDMDDLQVLDYILQLSSASNRGDVAERLLEHFGSLKNVLEARPEQLRTVKGVGPKSAKLISAFVPVMKAWQRRANDAPSTIGNCRDAESFCLSLTSGERNEVFWVVCLNSRLNVIGKRKIATGSLSEVSAYPRLIMETALNYNAHSVLLTHNHPGGTIMPSLEDVNSTIRLQKLLKGVGIQVVDHIIVANDRAYSMIEHGDISYRVPAIV